MSWVHLPTRTGRAEVKAHIDPIPPGPYAYILQGHEEEFLKHYMSMQFERKNEFEFRLGYSIYAAGPSGAPIRIAYYWDTSD